MSFLFGAGREGHRDPELAEGNRRYRQHIARDINDERALAAGGNVAGHKRKSSWFLLGAVAVFFLLAALVRGGSSELTITRDCTTPAVVVGAAEVRGGEPFELRSTGPQDATYIITIDGTPVQGQPDRQVPQESTPDGPAYGLVDCVSPSFLVPAPGEPGEHVIGLLQYDASGSREVASVSLTVVG
ncbi:MAG: hypothetical protein H0T85_04085 [Geodermatophilaceae bacterium]|nr:hypothetical protein [Geodermatophilaceae bacterium]